MPMRIKEIYIKRYGPISDLTIKPRKGLQLIYGLNESGKTLLVDAVLKLIISGRAKDFQNIDRVDEQPEGYVVIENEGREIKLNGNECLDKYLNIDSHDLRNVFVIRDSDLVIHQEEIGYLRRVTDRLTGMQTEKIERLKACLQDMGRLTNSTSNAALSNKKEYGKVAEKRKKASELLEEIEEYIKNAKINGLDGLELKLLRTEKDLDETKNLMEKTEKARQKERYQKCRDALAEVKKTLIEIDRLKPFNQTLRDNLYRLTSDVDGLKLRLKENQQKLNKNSVLIEKEKKELRGKLAKADPLKAILQKISVLKDDIKAFRFKKEDLEIKIKTAGINRILAFTFFIGFLISAVFGSLRETQWQFNLVLPGICLAFFIYYVSKYVNLCRLKYRLELHKELILEKAAELGLETENLNQLLVKISRCEHEFDIVSSEIEHMQKEIDSLTRYANELEDSNRKIAKTILEKTKEINQEFNRLSINNINEFDQKLRQISEYQLKLFGHKALLENELGKPHDCLDKNIAYWSQQIKQLEKYDFNEPDLRYDEKEAEDLKQKYDDLTISIEQLKKQINRHREKMREFENRFTALYIEDFLDDDINLNVVNLDMLEVIADYLRRFIDRIDTDFRNAVTAIKIFEEIQSEEEAKISDLFNSESCVTVLFKQITEGRYQEIKYNSEEKLIQVIKDGLCLNSSQLSKGAFDQLYLSLRVSLAQKILGNKKGFFIMDDAFLSSDIKRIEHQVKILKDLCDKGWNILYLSMKEEIKNVILNYCPHKIIELKQSVRN